MMQIHPFYRENQSCLLSSPAIMTGRNGLFRGSCVYVTLLKGNIKKKKNSFRKYCFPGRFPFNDGTVKIMGQEGRKDRNLEDFQNAMAWNRAFPTEEDRILRSTERTAAVPAPFLFSSMKCGKWPPAAWTGGSTIKKRVKARQIPAHQRGKMKRNLEAPIMHRPSICTQYSLYHAFPCV